MQDSESSRQKVGVFVGGFAWHEWSLRTLVKVSPVARHSFPSNQEKKRFYLLDLATSFTAPSRISSPESTRSLVMISGGAMRRVEWPAVISARPRRKDFIIISYAVFCLKKKIKGY